VLVSGRLQSRSWEQDGQKRNKVEVVAQDVTFLGGRGEGGEDGQATTSAPKSSANKASQKDVVIDDISDEPIDLSEIPF
jgi:single-strand DNA-binding protein